MRKNKNWREDASLIIVSFSIGFFAIVSQVSFLREMLVVFYGNELCVGLIFSFWLVGIFLGALIASYGRARASRLAFMAGCILLLLIILTPIQLAMVRFSRIIFSTPPGEYIQFFKIVAASVLFVSPTSILIGSLFPIVAKLFSSRIDKNANAVTNVYVWEAVGSLVGGCIFTFLLIPYYDTFTILFLSSSFPAVSIAVISAPLVSPVVKACLRGTSFILLIMIILSFIFGFSIRVNRITAAKRWASFASTIELIEEKDSKYQSISLAKQDEMFSIYLNGQYQYSFPDPYQSSIKAHVVMSQHPNPESMLIMGGGCTGLLEEILKYPLKRIDYVELDPTLIHFVQKYLSGQGKNALIDPRIRIHHLDGRHFLKFSRHRYDIILVNSQDPSTAFANRCYTLEFFREVKQKLDPAGLFVTSIASSLNYFGEDMLGYVSSVYNSLRSVFQKIIITPTEEAFLFASDCETTLSSEPDILASRFQQRKIKTSIFTGDYFKLLLPTERVEFVKRTMEERVPRDVNTDFRPVTYFYSLKLWARYSGSSIQKILSLIEEKGMKLWFLFTGLILFLFLTFIFPFGRKADELAKPPLILCIASTGFSGMAWSLILIFSFQNILGYLYGAMGILIAFFMLGLAAGGLAMRFLQSRMSTIFLITISDLFVLAFSVLLIPALHFLYSMDTETSHITELHFSILMFASGFLTGFEFPVTIKLYLSVSNDIRRSAGIIDGADHIGAALGALLTGVLFIPLAGLWLTTVAVGMLKAASFIVLISYFTLRAKSAKTIRQR